MGKGRKPKIEKINYNQIEAFGKFGLTDVQIAEALGVSKATLNNYKKKYPQFLDSLKKGKEVSDAKVVESLYKRATGYSHPDVHISNYQGVITITQIIKHYPPDPLSIAYWLNNRQPDQWKNRREDITGLSQPEIEALRTKAAEIMQENL